MGFLIKEQKLRLMRKIRDTEGLSTTELHQGIYAIHGTTTKILNILEKRKFIKSEKKGRKRISTLTKKGKKTLELLELVEERL